MPNFTVKPLDPADIDKAYPLVRSAMPGFGLEDWRRHAHSLFGNGGVLTLVGPDGVLHALACWTIEHRLAQHMRVETFVAFELSRRAPAREALCDGLRSLASALGCSSIMFAMESRGLIATHSPAPESPPMPHDAPESSLRAHPVNPGVPRMAG